MSVKRNWTFKELNAAAKELGTFSGQLSAETLADNFSQVEEHDVRITSIHMSTWMFRNSTNLWSDILIGLEEPDADSKPETEGFRGHLWGSSLSTFESEKAKNIVYLVARDDEGGIVKVKKMQIKKIRRERDWTFDELEEMKLGTTLGPLNADRFSIAFNGVDGNNITVAEVYMHERMFDRVKKISPSILSPIEGTGSLTYIEQLNARGVKGCIWGAKVITWEDCPENSVYITATDTNGKITHVQKLKVTPA